MGSQWVTHTLVEVADHLSLKSRSINSDDLQVEKKRAEQGGAAAVVGLGDSLPSVDFISKEKTIIRKVISLENYRYLQAFY